jgi:protein-S-isoprenylcysteine O-methyltransferase Ste14
MTADGKNASTTEQVALTFKEKFDQSMKDANKYFQNDEHAGAVAGLLLGSLFLIFGLCVMLIREDGVIPSWRKMTGVVLVVLGSVAIITSSAFALMD